MCAEDSQGVLCLSTWLDNLADVIRYWHSAYDCDTEYLESRDAFYISAIGGGGETGRFLLLSLKTISRDFFLLSTAYVSMPSVSDTRDSALHAGTIIYVSSTNLHISFPRVVTFKSAAVTTYAAGPTAEHWMILASIICTVDCWPWYSVLCECPVNQPVTNLVWNVEQGPASPVMWNGGQSHRPYWSR